MCGKYDGGDEKNAEHVTLEYQYGYLERYEVYKWRAGSLRLGIGIQGDAFG